MEENLNIWLIADLFVRILTMVAVIKILSKSYSGLWFLFHPFLLAVKNFKRNKKANLKIDKLFFILFLSIFFIGVLLYINREIISFLPTTTWRVLLDHFIAGFLITILFYMLFLGINVFFFPSIKINYNIKWYGLAMVVAILSSFLWEGLIQNFSNIYQILAELFGIFLSLIYFLIYRKKIIKNQKINQNITKNGN